MSSNWSLPETSNLYSQIQWLTLNCCFLHKYSWCLELWPVSYLTIDPVWSVDAQLLATLSASFSLVLGKRFLVMMAPYRPLACMTTSIIHLDVADKDQEWDATSHHNLIKCLICENEKQSRSALERCFSKRCKCWFDESSCDDIQWDQFSDVKRVVLMRQCRVGEINTGRGRWQEE